MKKIIFLIIALLPLFMFAQNTISGTVCDIKNNELMPNVYVYIPDLQKGTVTNINGVYELNNLPNGFLKIQYSFLGYKTQINTIELKNTTLEVNVKLEITAIQTQEVIVSGGQAGSQHEHAIKIETLNKEALNNASDDNVIKKLTQIAGIDAISKGNSIATPVIRGLSTSNILVLNNGIRMENFQFSEDHPYTIDASDVSNVEIIKGPASLLYGSDAVGGVLNFIKEPPAAINTTKAKFQTQYNTNNKSTNTSFNFKSSGNNFFGGISGNFNSAMDYISGTNESVPNSRSNNYSTKAFTGLRNSKGIFKLHYDYNKMQLGITNPPAINLVTDNLRKNGAWYQNLDNHMLISQNTLFFNQLKIDLDLSYQHNHRKLQGNPDAPIFTIVDMSLNSVTWQAKGRYDFSKHSNFILSTQGLIQNNKNGDAPNHILPNFSTLANSLAALWQYNSNEKIFYQIGARYDFKQIAVPTQHNGGSIADTLLSFNKNYSNVSFSTGLTYKLTHHILIRGNIASAYRTPTVAELLQDGVHGNRFEQGNRDFKTQRNIEGDLSVHFHTNNFVIDISSFYNQIYNYIYIAPTNDTTENGFDIYRYSQNDANLYGIELSGQYNLLNNFVIKVTYAHITAQQSNGDNLPFIPQNKININLSYSKSYHKFFEKIQLAVNPLIAFEQNEPHVFETNTDSYFVLNTFLNAQMNFGKQKIEVGVFANNILNTTYYDHLSTLKELGYYNMGRNISLRIKIPLSFN